MDYCLAERRAVHAAQEALALAYRAEYKALVAAYHAGGEDDNFFPWIRLDEYQGCGEWVKAALEADGIEEVLITSADPAYAARHPALGWCRLEPETQE